MSDRDADAIRDLLDRYQQAHKDQDWDAVRACHGPTYFRWFGNESTDPADWVPDRFLTQNGMLEWGRSRLPPDTVYEEDHELRNVVIRGDMAIAILHGSGCWRSTGGRVFVRWDNIDTVWFTARIDGEWRIVAAFFGQSTLKE